MFTQNGIGAKHAGKELGDTVTYNGPTTVSGAAQVPFIDTAARQGYNAIVISTPDANAVAPALKRAAAKGVKIIAYDGDTAQDARTIFVAPSTNSLIGAYAGQVDRRPDRLQGRRSRSCRRTRPRRTRTPGSSS